jgi:hypothetical protein
MNQTVILEETTDGDLFFEIPDDLLDTLGWTDGTELAWSVLGNSIRITRATDERNDESPILGYSRVERTLGSLAGVNEGVDFGDDVVVGEPT